MKRIGVYLRVSTKEQSTDLQKLELLQYCKDRGFTNIQIYEDHGFSGTTDKRPALKTMLEAARHRKLNIILIWKLDRLFRSLKHMVNTLSELTELGVEFIALKDNIDMTTAQGQLLLNLLSSFSEFEAALISERVTAGMKAAKARGSKLGKRRKMDAGKIQTMRGQGMSFGAIAQAMGVSRSGVFKTWKDSRVA